MCADELYLALGGCMLRLRSNSTELLAGFADYFSHVATDAMTPAVDIIAIERDMAELDMEFIDWKREPGKTGRKDSLWTCRADAWCVRCAPAWLFYKAKATGLRPDRALKTATR